MTVVSKQQGLSVTVTKCLLSAKFGCRYGRTERVQHAEEFHISRVYLIAALKHCTAAAAAEVTAAFPWCCFYLPNIRDVSFSLHLKLNQSSSKVTANRAVLCELCQEGEPPWLHIHQLKDISIKVLKHGSSPRSYHRDTFIFGTNFDTPPAYTI